MIIILSIMTMMSIVAIGYPIYDTESLKYLRTISNRRQYADYWYRPFKLFIFSLPYLLLGIVITYFIVTSIYNIPYMGDNQFIIEFNIMKGYAFVCNVLLTLLQLVVINITGKRRTPNATLIFKTSITLNFVAVLTAIALSNIILL